MLLIEGSLNDWEAVNENGIEFYGYNNLNIRDAQYPYIDTFNNFSFK